MPMPMTPEEQWSLVFETNRALAQLNEKVDTISASMAQIEEVVKDAAASLGPLTSSLGPLLGGFLGKR